jgi:preprotein translocase subunit SecA
MDALKSGIGLRGYGQKDPRVEYEKEAYEIFEDLKNNIADEAIKAVFAMRVEIGPPPDGGPDGMPPGAPPPGDGYATPQFAQVPGGEIAPQPMAAAPAPVPSAPRMDPTTAERLLGPAPKYEATNVRTNLGDEAGAKPKPAAAAANAADKVGRNDLCPCGSGKKYKKCHGAAA